MKYPPMSLLGEAAYVFGIANTINDVAPSDAIIAVSVSTFKNNSEINKMLVAIKHCII
jgi:hypothetical protein